jgi:hypothetical protein
MAELDESLEDLLAVVLFLLLLARRLAPRLRRLLGRRRRRLGLFLVDVVEDRDLEFFPAYAPAPRPCPSCCTNFPRAR